MKKYKYKASGIEWLGDIPEHWKVDRLRDNCIINDKALSNKTDKDYSINYLDISNVNSLGIVDFNEIKTIIFNEAPSRARRIVQKNDTVISSVRTNLQAVANINFEIENLICSTGFFVCRPRYNSILNERFLYFFLLTDYSKDFFFSLSVGVSYPAIDDYKFSSIKIPIPPLKEQKAIAEYLDKATTRIDRIIAIKQEQLESIETTYISIRHKLITQGLNHTKYISYDDDFLSKVPIVWKKWKLRYLLQLKNGKLIKNEELVDGGDYPVYGGNGIMAYTDKFNYEDDLIILGRVGAKCGNVHYTNQKIWVSDNAIAVRTSINYSFTFHLLNVLNLKRLASETAQPLLVGNNIKNLYVAIPPVDEQIEIVNYLNQLENKSFKTISNIKSQINTLQAYRKSLIHECVTGKKQVVKYK